MQILKSKILLAVIIVITGWLGLSFINIRIQEDIVNKEIKDLESKISHLENDNIYTEKLVGYLKHPSFLEREARLRLNYKKPGEETVFVYPDSAEIVSGSLELKNKLDGEPGYIKWWQYLERYLRNLNI